MPSKIRLPKPALRSRVSLEETLSTRRTCRSFQPKGLSAVQLGQLLWAAYGVTARKWGLLLKSAPSAGALYPLDVFAICGKDGTAGLEAGTFHYQPPDHALAQVKAGDARPELARAALNQSWLAGAPAVLVISGEYARCTKKYGRRGIMYTHMESGAVAQSIFLEAQSLGLKAGIIGAFDNQRVRAVLGLPKDYDPLLLMPVGRGA